MNNKMEIYYKDKDIPKLKKNEVLVCMNCKHEVWMLGLHFGDRETNECGFYSEKTGACGCCHVDGVFIANKRRDGEYEQ